MGVGSGDGVGSGAGGAATGIDCDDGIRMTRFSGCGETECDPGP